MIDVAAEIAYDLQWPLDVDLRPSMARLLETLKSCFHSHFDGTRFVHEPRTDMVDRAISCGRTYCSLRRIFRAQEHSGFHPEFNHWSSEWVFDPKKDGDTAAMKLLWNVIRVYDEWPDWSGVFEVASSEQWALRLVPSLWKYRLVRFGNSHEPLLEFLDQFPAEGTRSIDAALFTDYLCSICALVTRRPMDTRLISQQDKT
jgi:hypothetical protein